MRKTSKTNKVNCKTCGKEFMSSKTEFCSTKCRNIEYAKKESETLSGVENQDYVVCRWCGMKAKRLYLGHFKLHHPGKTSTEYKNEFPGAQLACKTDNMNIAKAYIKYTKSDKGRLESSERIKGEKNPNSKEHADKDTRKQRSPFSKSYYIKLGYSEDDAKEKVSNFAKTALNNRVSDTTLKYWLLKTNGDIDLAKSLLKDRQTTFSLEKCIAKYGEVEGRLRWENRQILWKSKIYANVTCLTSGTSNISNELANSIKNHNINIRQEFFLRSKEYCYVYDIEFNKKIIEFNDDFWHCNPAVFEPTYLHPIKKTTAENIWKYDAEKEKVAKSKGYDYLIVWEKDYRENSEIVIRKCINFLNEKNIN